MPDDQTPTQAEKAEPTLRERFTSLHQHIELAKMTADSQSKDDLEMIGWSIEALEKALVAKSAEREQRIEEAVKLTISVNQGMEQALELVHTEPAISNARSVKKFCDKLLALLTS